MNLPTIDAGISAVPIRVRHLSKSFGANKVLEDVSFALAPGSVTGLLGTNGSGKSTLIKSILGLLRPDAGEIDVFGWRAGSEEARQRQGVMLQDIDFPSLLEVRELVTLFRKSYVSPMEEEEVMRLADLKVIYRKRYGSLSGGEKRRVQCAVSLCGDPRILLLDEPTAHMDAESKDIFWNAVYGMRAKGCCVVVVSHQRDEIRALADQILLLSGGRVVSHGSAEQHERGWSRVAFAHRPDMNLEALRQLSCVSEIRRVGRMNEAITSDVTQLFTQLQQMDIALSGVSVDPVVSGEQADAPRHGIASEESSL